MSGWSACWREGGGWAADTERRSETVGTEADMIVGLIRGNKDVLVDLDDARLDGIASVVISFEVVLSDLRRLGPHPPVRIHTDENPFDSSERAVLSFEIPRHRKVFILVILIELIESRLRRVTKAILKHRKTGLRTVMLNFIDELRGRNNRRVSILAME